MDDGYVDEIEGQTDESRPEERDLAEDAQWKKIQKNTFTRWTNQHLKVSGLQINDLQYDLSDGLKLVSLIQALASHQFKHVNKRPTFRTQKLENVTMVMKYLEDSEQLRLVNIDSTDIVDCRLKLILGLIWSLILHYSISMPLWEGEEPIARDSKGKGPSPKQRILSWLNSKMPDKPVKNLTTDWNNGIAIGALVDALAPGLCPDWTDWNPKDALKNAKEAMDLAEKWLDVAQLLKPEEMIDPRIDEKALMTYLSQFPRAKLKEGAPLRPKTNPARVRAYGPGLEKTGNAVKAPARFTVDAFSAGIGKLEVLVLNPKGSNEPCTVELKPNQTQIYACTYTPTMQGEYRVIIKYASKEIPNSPYAVTVEASAGDPNKVTASGPGIERKGNVMGKRTFFNVFLNGAGLGNIECKIKDPQNREEIVKPLVTKQTDDNFLVEYTPILSGLHSVEVLFAGRPIPQSPYAVEVSTDSGKNFEPEITPKSTQANLTPAGAPKKTEDSISLQPKKSAPEAAYVTGRGIQPKGLRVNEPTEFTVHTEKAGPGKVQAKVVGPGGVNEPVKITPGEEYTFICQYKPTKVGQYVIVVEYGSGQVQKSPFKVDVAAASKSKVIAYGPGLKSGVVNSPAPFTVESHGSPGELGFNIEGPSEAKITCSDNGDGSAAVQYVPLAPGEYAVHVLCNKEDIKGSPFMAQIKDLPSSKFDASKVKAFGPGLEPNGVQVNKETHFTIDIKNAGGPAEIKTWCHDANGNEIPIKVSDSGNSTFTCTYTTKIVGKHTVFISYGGIEVTGSPFKVNVSGASVGGAVVASGPGLQSAVVGKPAVFTIDTKGVGGDTGPITVDITTEDNKKVPFQSKDKDGVREIQYTPTGTVQTRYTIKISYKNQPVNNSPFTVPIQVSTATGVAYATGRGIQPKGIRVNEEVTFNVHTENAPSNGIVKAKLIGPGGIQETVKITKVSEILFVCQYKPTKVGNYVVTVDYANVPVSGGPFKIQVDKEKQTKIRAYGPGLEKCTVGIPAPFTVETNNENSKLGFAIKGPSEAKIDCKDNGDGSVSVQYHPTKAGEHAVHITTNEEDIPGSPFMVMATEESKLPKIDINKIKVFGPGIEPQGNLSEKPTSFTVDAKAFKDKRPLEVKCFDCDGTVVPVQITEKPDSTYTCAYTPLLPKKHMIYVSYDGIEVPKSPYKINVERNVSGCVKASGPGLEKATSGQQTYFVVDTTEVGSQTTALSIDIRMSKGQQVPFNSKVVKPGVCEISYTPVNQEDDTINIVINYESEPIKGSPFKISSTGTKSGVTQGRVYVTGKGVLPKGVSKNEPVTFKVHVEKPTTNDNLKTKVVGPGGAPINVQTKKISNNLYECQYTCPQEGNHVVSVDFNAKPVEKSPFQVHVGPVKQSKITAFGPGLEGGIEGLPAVFTVNPNGETSKLDFKIQGPKEAELTCKDNGDGTVGVQYIPLEKGEYIINVLSNNEDIPKSPFVVDITSAPDTNLHPEKVKAFGPGLQTPGVLVGKPTQFTVDTTETGTTAPVSVKCYDSVGSLLPVQESKTNNKVSNYTYNPTKPGKHTVSITYGGVAIQKSPFEINVGDKTSQTPQVVTAYGPGLTSAESNTPTSFIIDSTPVNGTTNKIQHSILDNKNQKLPTKTTELAPGKQEVSYTPVQTPNTNVKVNVSYDGKPIGGSPFSVPVQPKKDKHVTASGRGIQPVGLRVNENVSFNVESDVPIDTKELKPKIIGPGGVQDQATVTQVTPNKLQCTYAPSRVGNYSIITEVNGKPVEKSPFKVDVAPKSQCPVKAFGAGLENGQAKVPAKFIVETNGETGNIGFEVKGPSEAKLSCKDLGNGVVEVEYIPETEGEYAVRVLCNNSDIQDSPFMVPISPATLSNCDLNKVKVYGPGIESKPISSDKETNFTVDTRECGPVAPTVVKCYDKKGEHVPVNITKTPEGLEKVTYTPKKEEDHIVQVLVDNKEIPASPYKVNVEKSSGPEAPKPTNNVIAYGPGLTNVEPNTPTSFIIDSSGINGTTNKIQHAVIDDKNQKLPTKTTELAPGKQEVSYTPVQTPNTDVKVNVSYDGKPIGGSPFSVPVQPKKDKHVTASGRGIQPVGLRVNENVSFNVESDVPIDTKELKPKIIGPGGVQDQATVTQVTPNKLQCTYAPSRVGNYSIITEVNGKPVEKSPFKVDVAPKSQCPVKAFGAGLENGQAKVPARFIVETNGETGNIGFEVKGPSEAKLSCKDLGNGVVEVEYIPETEGEYAVRVLCNSSDIQDSPFMIPISSATLSNCDLNKVKVYGPGIESKPISSDKETNFTVDTRECGPVAPTVVKCYDKKGEHVPVNITKTPEGLEKVTYTPKKEEDHIVQVLVDDKEIPSSPFKVNVQKSQLHDATKPVDGVIAYGSGLQSVDQNSDKPVSFYVDCRPCDMAPSSKPTIEVWDEKRNPIPADIKSTGTQDLYEATYVPSSSPQSERFHPKITVDGENIPGSPFVVPIKKKETDDKICGVLEDLQKSVKVLQPQQFNIKLNDNIKEEPTVVVTDKNGNPSAPVDIKKVKPNTYQANYTPSTLGSLVINASADGKPVKGTPVCVSVVDNPQQIDEIKVVGLAPIVESGKPQSFEVLSPNNPITPNLVDVKVRSPSNKLVPVQKESVPEGTKVTYVPEENGPHTVGCWVNDQPVTETPCIVKSAPKREIPELLQKKPLQAVLSVTDKEAQVDKPNSFLIANGDIKEGDDVNVAILSPDTHEPVPLKTNKLPEGLLCEFTPKTVGPHSLLASINNLPVEGSPAVLVVQEMQPVTENPIKLEKADVVRSEKPCNALEEAIKEMKEIANQTSKWPQSSPEQPSAKVLVYGEGLNKVCATEKAAFTIDSREAPSAPIGVTVEGPGEAVINCIDNGDGTCGVIYEAPVPGLYTVNVLYDNIHIPQSPIIVPVYPKDKKDIDLSAITASGPGLSPEGVFKDCFAKFTVDSSKVNPNGEGTIKALIQSPSDKKTVGLVENTHDGKYVVRYTPTEEGPHKINVTYEGLPIQNSPFIVNSKPGFNAKLVTAKGPGLKSCKVNEKTQFLVDLDGAGHGSLGLAIEGPADAEIQCHDNKDGTCLVEYTPVKAGDYEINVKFNEEDITDSPFHVQVLDEVKPEKVKCQALNKDSKLMRPNHFTVDTTEAGKAPLQVTVSQPESEKPEKPATVKQIEGAAPGVFDVCFVPETMNPCLIHVKYDNTPVPGSPFKTNVVQPAQVDKVKVIGDGIVPPNGTILASMPAVFHVETKDAGSNADVNVGLFNPNGEPMPLHIEARPNGLYTCEYQTHDVGDHKISVDVDGEPLPKSPYTVKSIPTGNADKCQIKEGKEKVIQANKESVITVETKEAGKGQITCSVKRIEKQKVGQMDQIKVLESVKVEVQEHPDGITSVHYVPKEEGEYLVEVKFGGKTIPNGKFIQTATYSFQEIRETKTKALQSQMSSQVATSAFHGIDFELISKDINTTDLNAKVVRPSGTIEPVPITVKDDQPHNIKIEYQPSERGPHQLQINSQGRPIKGSPFQFFVDTKGEGRVTAYGPGLSSGSTNEVASFTIITKDAGPGGLSLIVEGPSKTEIKCEDNQDGTFNVSYVPQAPGNYNIIIKFKDQPIAGSPFIAKITGEPIKKSQIAVGNSSEIPLKIPMSDMSTLTAELTTPSKKQLPCVIKKMDNGALGVSFTPKETGEHLVNVFEKGKDIPGSPFKINVKNEEVGDAGKVKVRGEGLERGFTNKLNEFIIDTRDAGYGSLNISIEGPSKAEIDCKDNEDGTCTVKYLPTEPGKYVINVTYAGKNVNNSPFTVEVEGDRIIPSETQKMEHVQEAAKVTKVGGNCEINLKMDDISLKDLKVNVHTPSGFTEPCDIEDIGNGNIKLKFVARESGVHYVSVLYRDRHITGSPFQFTVGNVPLGGPNNVTASGPGLEHGAVNVENEFTIYTREAGAGNISVAIEGPSKAVMKFQESQDKGSCEVTYQVSKPGDYECIIKFNGEHIANSPFHITVTDDSIKPMNARAVSSSFTEETVAKDVGGLISITVRAEDGEIPKLEASVQTPSGNMEPAVVQKVAEGQYGVKFTPRESGVHLVFVENNKKPVNGSPFRIPVGEFKADPGMVHASGEGLSHGFVDEKAHFFVNTTNAGSGSLNVAIDGPSKVKMNCHETEEGYEFTYIATAPGSYIITITYGGNFHIVGSPFTAIIEGNASEQSKIEQHSQVEIETSDKRCVSQYAEPTSSYPDKVICQGLGIKKAKLNSVNSFFVDASQAGYGILLVGICGPVRPCEEVVVKHVGNNQFTVDYVVKESGTHIIMVRWGDKDISGSPFMVHVD